MATKVARRRQNKTDNEEIEKLTREIGLILHGHDRIVQSAVIADLLAIWLAGHAPFLRDGVLRRHIKLVRDLVPVNEFAFFGEAGHPDGRH
jgi:hypothetical protein